jgi:hypothetical protein
MQRRLLPSPRPSLTVVILTKLLRLAVAQTARPDRRNCAKLGEHRLQRWDGFTHRPETVLWWEKRCGREWRQLPALPRHPGRPVAREGT